MYNKKLKTGKVVDWAVVDSRGYFEAAFDNRPSARQFKNKCNGGSVFTLGNKPFRIAKLVVTK